MRIRKFVLIGCLLVGLLVSAAYCETTTPVVRPITVVGMITATDLEQGSVTIQRRPVTTDAAQTTFYVTDRTRIVKDGQPATLQDLAVGDECAAVCLKTSDGKLVAQTVRAKTPVPPVIRVDGKIVSIDFATSTFKLDVGATGTTRRVMWFVIDRSTVIRKDGKVAAFGDLKVGDLAMVAFSPPVSTTADAKPILALVVNAKTPPPPIAHIIGRLVRISDTGVIAVLRANTNAPVLFQVTNETKIVKVTPVDLSALVIGDTVDVSFLKSDVTDVAIPKAIAITVLPNYFSGSVALIDLLNRVVTCQPIAVGDVTLGRAIRFQVVPETVIIRLGKQVTLEELRLKDLVQVKYFTFTGEHRAVAIVAKPPVSTTPTPVL